ncbi:rfaE bifunctional protein nucleotidyltransferase chain/domain [Pedobacter sp. AK013]|uniref:D-glycero-beta-D-manno-heptose 1-phosphate adenylyltransferase n=1 Tax=Pedobacter sp. AK013 TaxID=2723071 RepID=UPI001618FFA7|nr:D-glycero-beta-D-manno-heptose 1-phosphate adenylyltransferase [Pedobacter sp. AK013]MBB6240088.1 rfaE bifunctional protein nucleotidyltransferase chain/domain [Pedobacter sp. AK013]
MVDNIETLAGEKVFSQANIDSAISKWKQDGEKIVFTNGCFDLLHIGHLSYMLKAASLGTKLVIGLNSDTSVKRLKGESRPINKELSRSLMLASLFFIDAVAVFEEDTPLELIRIIKPDVLVKGGDYKIEDIVGAKEVLAEGGSVQTIDFVNGYSSTNLINKIKENQIGKE